MAAGNLPVLPAAGMAAKTAARPRAAFLVAGLLLIGSAAALAAVAVSVTSASGQVRWGSAALAACCAGLLPLMSAAAGQDGLGLASWRIGPWAVAWGALAFGLSTLSWLSPQAGPSAAILPASILRALWLMAAAFALLTTGYCAAPAWLAGAGARRVTAALGRRFTDEIRGPLVPWVLLAAGVAGQLGYALLNGHLGFVGDAAASVTTASGYGQYLAIAGECVPLSVLAAGTRAFASRTPGSWLALGITFAAAIAIGAVAGGKESFVVAILAVIIPWTTTRQRLPAGFILAAVLVFLLVVIPFNQAYRAAARGTVTLSTSQAVAAAPAIASQMAASDLSLAVLAQSASYLSERIRTIDTPAIILQRTPAQIPYASPAGLLLEPATDLIPRILWPGKPVLAPGYQVSQEYYDLPPQVYTSSNVTPEGDLYRHGGWLPLIAGMLVLGGLIRVIDEVADLRRGPHGAFLVLLFFPGIVEAGSDWATLIAGIPGVVLLWLAVVSLCFARTGPDARTAGGPAPGRRARTRPPSR